MSNCRAHTVRPALLLTGTVLGAAACAPLGTSGAAHVAAPPASAQPIVGTSTAPLGRRPATPTSPTSPRSTTTPAAPLFATPEAAMRFVAAAYNRGDFVALRRVTTPTTRKELRDMGSEAVNLRFDSCEPSGSGVYVCHFLHDYPRAMDRAGHGSTEVAVSPASRPGWYVSEFVGCG